MRENIYSEDHKTADASNFWRKVNVPKLILNYILLCSPVLQPQWGLGIFRNYIHPEGVYHKASKDQGSSTMSQEI